MTTSVKISTAGNDPSVAALYERRTEGQTAVTDRRYNGDLKAGRQQSRGGSRPLATVALFLLLASCATTPHTPTRVLPQSRPALSGIDSGSGYVYDELLSDSGISLNQGGQITAVTSTWAKKALGRVLDLQQALDECQAEKRALISK